MTRLEPVHWLNGRAKLTKGYNLPAKYVLHTVGPVIQGRVTWRDRNELKLTKSAAHRDDKPGGPVFLSAAGYEING